MNRPFAKCLIALGVTLSLVAGATAAEWPDFQARGDGPGSDGKMVGGLGFTLVLKDDPKATHPPKLWKIPAIVVSGDYWNTEPSFLPPGPRRPMDLGAISCGEPSAPEPLERDWAHGVLALSPSLKVYVTRLSPALVFDCAAPRLTLFGGGKTTPIGFATPKGVFKADQPPAEMLGNAGKQWMLVWFGKGAALRFDALPLAERPDSVPVRLSGPHAGLGGRLPHAALLRADARVDPGAGWTCAGGGRPGQAGQGGTGAHLRRPVPARLRDPGVGQGRQASGIRGGQLPVVGRSPGRSAHVGPPALRLRRQDRHGDDLLAGESI